MSLIAIGDVGFTDSYIGTKYLGAEQNGRCPSNPRFRVHYNTWQFRNSSDPLYFAPENDLQRYGKMRNGQNFLAGWQEIKRLIRLANNRSQSRFCGPF